MLGSGDEIGGPNQLTANKFGDSIETIM